MSGKKIETVPVALGDRAYEILIGPGLLAEAGVRIAPLLKRGKAAIVTDETVARHYAPMLAESFARATIAATTIALPPGEGTKSFAGLERLSEALLAAELERGDMIVALGGGVIGDLAGFAAGILKRGIDFVQIPTTLLAQVDSSVGGKTAINATAGKNMIGLFYQPRLVLADTGVLATLPEREMHAGYAEIAKYGLLGDAEFFAWCETNGKKVLARDPAALAYAIKHSCEMKAHIVARDEREGGVRALLNLGHTFGHALEAETGYSAQLLHGESVAIGCALAFDLSARLGLCSPNDAARVRAHFRALGLKAAIADIEGLTADPQRLIAHMAHDKKVAGGKLTFILARGIGEAFITQDVPMDALVAVLAAR
ncbi:MAG: 3-dehydroquinate synthase [Alphaproteobacteria bacterium]|nr:3-dehydroquinate synthase [Alphaproteobacteria bacterium]